MTIGIDKDPREFAGALAPGDARARLAVEILTQELSQDQLVQLAVDILKNELLPAQTDGDRMLKMLAPLTRADCGDLMRCIGEAVWSWEITSGELFDAPYETLCAMVEAERAKTRTSTEAPIPPPFHSERTPSDDEL